MRQMVYQTVYKATYLVCLLTVIACATKRPAGKTEAEILYREAKELIEKSRYLLATEKLNAIRSQYPYSYYASYAELLSADVLYKQKNYPEAAAAYIVFNDFHPKHKRKDYILFRIADSFYKQLPSSFDRDLSSGLEAIKYYRELIALFPNSKYTKDAQERIDKCNRMIENKEKYIADFYYKVKNYGSARHRYLSILKEGDKFKRIKDHSMVRIIQASSALRDKKACIKYFPTYKQTIKAEHKGELSRAYDECIN